MLATQVYATVIKGLFSQEFKMMLHEKTRNDDFQHNAKLQHCCNIVSNSSSVVPTLQRFVPLKIVVENRLGQGIIYQKIDKLYDEMEFCV